MDKYHYYQKALEKKREQKEFRQLRCVAGFEEKKDPQRINFASNDFLGLSQHSYVKKNTIKYVLEWGAGTTPSRLVTEHLECHRSVEEKLSELVGKDAALLFPSAARQPASPPACGSCRQPEPHYLFFLNSLFSAVCSAYYF